MSPQSFAFEASVREDAVRLRLDVYLADQIEDASRSFIQKVIKEGCVRINGAVCTRPSRIVASGDIITADLPPPPSTTLEPEDIPIEVLYEDSELVVVNKPPGLVVHPAPGHYTGTLINAILYRCPDFQKAGEQTDRPGIVHRLDQFTSGALVVAKTPRAFLSLSQQAREHTFDRRYVALVRGEFKEDRGRIDAPMGRSMTDPTRMTVTGVKGREAVTRFEVLERFGVATLIALALDTGRTHQIRVHLRFVGRPVLGDPVYGTTDFAKWNVPGAVKNALARLRGQALHAERLGFTHPASGERVVFAAHPPAEFQAALEALRTLI